MTSKAEIDSLLTAYADACFAYEDAMRIAKTSRSMQKRINAAYAAEEAYEKAEEIKTMLRGCGIVVQKKPQ